MEKSLISVIIPVYNVAPYIDSCLKSVVGQTYKNIEIILIEDGSCDESGTLCDQWMKKDKRIHVIHQKNSGVSHSRNIGLRIAKGEYITFCDADDSLEASMYEKMISKIVEEKADMCCCGYARKYGDREEVCCPTGGVYDREQACALLIDDVGFFTSVWNKMYRYECCIGNEIMFDETIHMNEDGEWNAKVLTHITSVVCVDEALYSWRRRSDSATHFNGKNLHNNQKSLTVIEAWESIYHIFRTVSRTLEQKSYKRFLAVIKERMIAAYSVEDKIYKQLLLRGERAMMCSGIIKDSDKLFLIKYRLLIWLVKLHVKPIVVKWVDVQFHSKI